MGEQWIGVTKQTRQIEKPNVKGIRMGKPAKMYVDGIIEC